MTSNETTCLASGKLVKNSSSSLRLNPILNNNLLQLDGRLNASAMQWQSKHSNILPNDGIESTLTKKDVHESSGHIGRQHALSNFRQQSWLVKVNSAVRKTLNSFAFRIKIFGQPYKQKMVDLSEDSLLLDKPLLHL